MTQDGLALEYVLEMDVGIIMAAITQDVTTLQYVPHELRTNREFMLAAVIINGSAFRYAAEEIKADREIVLAAVTENGVVLEYAVDELLKQTERSS